MKSTGIIRSLDHIGRFKIPRVLLKKLNINPKDFLLIHKEDGNIVISKYKETCIFCEKNLNIVEIKGKKVCQSCLNEFKNLNI